jgi:pimeloyl-ACP methyl ester carboxylesterase
MAMIELQFPGPSAGASPSRASVESGMLVVVRQRADLTRLVQLCSFIRTDSFSRRTQLPQRIESSADDRLRQLVGALLSGRFPNETGATPPEVAQAEAKELKADDAYEALLLGLLAIAELWPTETDSLALCLALALPGGSDHSEVVIRLDRPRAALWVAPGSIAAGISVGVALKAAKWCAIVTSTFTSASADAAAQTLMNGLRDRAGAASKHNALPRLDKLSEADRQALRSRPVLVVLLHGLFGTDLGTFDGFITRLNQASPAALDDSLGRLAASAPLELVRAHAGVEQLRNSFKQAIDPGGERVKSVTDIELRRFIESRVGLVGWPHDSLAPVDTCATFLAALLKTEFAAQPPKHIVFVCHSQGGLLARATAIALKQMNAPASRWAERVAAIATFGTPHLGAAIVEPGGKGGREIALYLMMMSGTGKLGALRDVLTLVGERAVEGIEDLKAFNASTPERENAYVQRLLTAEHGLEWPGGGNRPHMLLVGGRLGPAQKATWLDRTAAAFIAHKLRHDDHDLVVELSSSTAPVVEPRVSVTVTADHFGYFGDQADCVFAMDAAVALIWTLLADEIVAWRDALEAQDKLRAQPVKTLKLKPQPPST